MLAHARVMSGLAFFATAMVADPALAQIESPGALEKTCRAGEAFACANLAVLYRYGRGVGQDNVRALTLFVRGCEGGNDFACGAVGDMVYRGLGIAAHYENGELLLRGACRRRNEWSCESLRRLGIPLRPS